MSFNKSAKFFATQVACAARKGQLFIKKHCFDYADRGHTVHDIINVVMRPERIGFTPEGKHPATVHILGGKFRVLVRKDRHRPNCWSVISVIPRDKKRWETASIAL